MGDGEVKQMKRNWRQWDYEAVNDIVVILHGQAQAVETGLDSQVNGAAVHESIPSLKMGWMFGHHMSSETG